MIVRNEEANLPACLASCADVFDELVIVDTGSTDRTKKIAAAARDKHGQPARVFDFHWRDDFSAARNESLKHATGDWVFWMDADDRLDEENRVVLRSLFSRLDRTDPAIAFAFDQLSDHPGGRVTITARLIRLFARRPDVRWVGCIHEELTAPVAGVMAHTGVAIRHTGYRDEGTTVTKAARDLPLLEKRITAEPQNIEMMRWAAVACRQLGRMDDAAAWQRRYESLRTAPLASVDDSLAVHGHG